MATYNLRDGIPSKISPGDILNYPFRNDAANAFKATGSYGGTIQITLPKGQYKLEVWGSSSTPNKMYSSSLNWLTLEGPGGYAKGILNLPQNTTAYLTAGGAGTNGGQLRSWIGTLMVGSGGASDIRLNANDTYHRVIVAGGGGLGFGSYGVVDAADPSDIWAYGGSRGGGGGGLTGGDAPYMEHDPDLVRYYATGATQTAPGTNGAASYPGEHFTSVAAGFGYGGYQLETVNNYIYSTGGGGWYGGGGGGRFKQYVDDYIESIDSSGGGGSGFTFSQATQGNVPSGFGLNSAYWLTDTANVNGVEEDVNITNPDGTQSKGRYGEGYVRITVLEVFNGIYIGSSAGKALAVKNIYIGDSTGKARKVIKGYIGDSTGKARRFL